MDHTAFITHLSTCSGYEGIGLGLSRVVPNLRPIAFSEIEAFAVANLVAKMEAGALEITPVYSNLKSFPWRRFRGLVGILSGGFPCQPFSAAGNQRADSDPRHLFPHILRGIVECQPDLVFLENVEGIFSALLKGDDWRDPAGTPVLLHVLRELERVGYRPEAGLFSSAEVGATHQRKRTFILAHRLDARLERYTEQVRQAAVARGGLPLRAGRPMPPGPGQWWWEPPRVIQDFVRIANRHGRFVDDAREALLADAPGARCGRGEDSRANSGDAGPERGRGVEPQRGGSAVADYTQGQRPGEARGFQPGGPQDGSPRGGEASRAVGNSDCARAESRTEKSGSWQATGEPGGNHSPKVGDPACELRERCGPGSEQGRSGESPDPGREAVADPECARGALDRCDERVGRGGQPDAGGPGQPPGIDGQAEPALGGDADGPAGGLDFSELCLSGDSRIDELRLIGNGVDPEVAARAFTVLLGRLIGESLL